MSRNYYGYYQSPIGMLKVTSSDKKLFSVDFVHGIPDITDIPEIDSELNQENELNQGNELVEQTVLQLDQYFSGDRRKFELDVFLEGTDFQKKVWAELTNIPFGQTRSYMELAIKIGKDKAWRAVGGANNKNKLAIIIPCHRVIGTNGKLVGYASGVEKKQWLLNHEQKFAIIDNNKK